MKTLTIETNGSVNICIQQANTEKGVISNTEDAFFSEAAVNAFNAIITQLQTEGCHYVHFEKSDHIEIKHKRRLAEVENWAGDFPDIFETLDQVITDYEAAAASAQAEIEPEVSE